MRVIYWLCLLSYALASVQVLLLLGGQPWHWGVLLALPLGWYVADAMSGLVHMLMDYHPCRPGVGLKEMFFYEGNRSSEDYLALRARTLKKLSFFETVSFDFKTHHPRPNALGRRTFEHQTLSLTVVLLPAFVGLNAALLLQLLDSASVALFLWVALSGMLLSQYLHGTLHRKKKPGPDRLDAPQPSADHRTGPRPAPCHPEPGFCHHQWLVKPDPEPRVQRPAKAGLV